MNKTGGVEDLGTRLVSREHARFCVSSKGGTGGGGYIGEPERYEQHGRV